MIFSPDWERVPLTELGYPSTRYEPAPLIDLRSREERARLSGSAVRAFFNIVDRWSLRDEDARELLGGVSNGPYYRWKRKPPAALDVDTLTRVSYLVGIFKALNIIYGEKLADAWVRLPNKNPIFGGATPVAYMIRGGIPAIQVVRRLLDARSGGV
jgi:hypothetical protein